MPVGREVKKRTRRKEGVRGVTGDQGRELGGNRRNGRKEVRKSVKEGKSFFEETSGR